MYNEKSAMVDKYDIKLSHNICLGPVFSQQNSRIGLKDRDLNRNFS